jgi:glycosyltransferase involved in cell wall biosynthesis
MQEAIRLVVGFFASLFAIAKVKPDIVYINEYVSLQALFAARLLGKKTVVQVRSPFVRGMFGLRRWLLAKSLAWFGHGVFAITEYEKNQIQDISRHTAHVHVVREFLSLENFTIAIDVAAVKKNLGLPLDKKIVLMVGGIYDIKGTLDFLHAAELVLAHRSDVYFVVAGKEYDMDPAYFAECKRFAGLPHIKDSFAFKGEVLNLVDYVTCCTMLVSSNTLTHFSRPVIEAWAQKKPVVATDMEHSKYLIEHNSDGLIVKVFDHGQMADAIETLLDNEEMAGRFGENGYAKARRDYDAKKNTGTILALCNEILGITQVA